ncbi:hypothetical protein PFISCL1PPCAC_12339, partial [Pristionchus fissidentatus]
DFQATVMFASVLASWWWGSREKREEEASRRGTVAEEKKKKKPVDDDDDIFSSEEEEENDEEMVEIRRRFRAAASFLPTVTDQLAQPLLLRMYGLYKAATAGPARDTDKPSIWDQKGRTKFAAWQAVSKMNKREAMHAYADELEDAGVGFDPSATPSTSRGGGFGVRISRPTMGGGEAGGDMAETPDSMEWSLWVTAAKTDDKETIERVHALNPEILMKKEDDTGLTALHWAADSGAVAVTRYLLEICPETISQLDVEGNQPLHLASLCGYMEVARILLDAGASPSIKNYERESALDIASSAAMKEMLRAKMRELGEDDDE